MTLPNLSELLVILFVVFLIFGVGKLPALGEALGKGIRNFKRSVGGDAAKGKSEGGR